MQDYQDQLVRIRRELHRNPEPGWGEFTTTALIIRHLREYGFEVLLGEKIIDRGELGTVDPRIVADGIARARANGVSEELLEEMQGLTGCVGILDTGRPGPTVAVRFDIDCIQVQESSDASHKPAALGFASQNNGEMHACGHDAHTSVGIALARWISENREKLSGKIKIIFQPDEEGVRGAAAMTSAGVVDDCDMFLASHCAMSAKSGEVATNLYGFLCVSRFDVTFTGKPAHAGACPQEGRNALAAAAHATVQMLGISRHSDGMTRVNVGQIIAGEGRNVIPSKAVLKMETRGETVAINNYMIGEVRNICEGVAKSFGVDWKIEGMGSALDLVADPEMVAMMNEAAEGIEGLVPVDTPVNFGGSEDATMFAGRVRENGGKAAFFLWGSNRPGGHHSATFDIDEKDLLPSMLYWANLVQKAMPRT